MSDGAVVAMSDLAVSELPAGHHRMAKRRRFALLLLNRYIDNEVPIPDTLRDLIEDLCKESGSEISKRQYEHIMQAARQTLRELASCSRSSE